MKTILALLVGVNLMSLGTGCSRCKCSSTVKIRPQGNAAIADPDPVGIYNDQLKSDKCWPYYTIRWEASDSTKPWLVAFDPADSPCEKDFVFEHGRKEVCLIDASQAKLKPFKYYAMHDNAVSRDPQVVHDNSKRLNEGGARNQTAGLTRFCLDLTKGSPVACNNTDPPQPPQTAQPLAPVHALDVIRWQGNSGWTVRFGNNSPCVEEDQIDAEHPYCAIKKDAATSCTDGAPYCTYTYTANSGPTFQVNVYPASSAQKRAR